MLAGFVGEVIQVQKDTVVYGAELLFGLETFFYCLGLVLDLLVFGLGLFRPLYSPKMLFFSKVTFSFKTNPLRKQVLV